MTTRYLATIAPEPPDPPEAEPDDDSVAWELGGEPDGDEVPSLAEQIERQRRGNP